MRWNVWEGRWWGRREDGGRVSGGWGGGGEVTLDWGREGGLEGGFMDKDTYRRRVHGAEARVLHDGHVLGAFLLAHLRLRPCVVGQPVGYRVVAGFAACVVCEAMQKVGVRSQ
jgi:hypothetical protein